MSYKVEELLALRDSVSESAVSLDKFADEEVIKEHVLRPSASATLASTASEKSLRVSLTPALTPAAPDKKPSPSPSIKRGKAERLLKEHGSPPGIRVTAGGRIVPSDLPPLNNVRHINNAYKPPTLRAALVGNTMATQRRPDTAAAHRLEVVGNQPVLYIGDRAYALPALDAASSTALAAGNTNLEAVTKPAQQPPALTAQSSFNNISMAPSRASSQTPFAGLDLPTLRSRQNLKKQELRSIEQTEVIQANQQPDSWRQGIIEKKRNVITELDGLRKQIIALEAAENNASPAQLNSFPGPVTAPSTSAPLPFAPQFQQPLPSPMFGYPMAAPFAPVMMYPPSFGAFPNAQTAEPAPFVPAPVPKSLSPGPNGRRSHAIAIKQPREANKQQGTSALDPKSPTYEPVSKPSSLKGNVHSTPSPTKQPSWVAHGVSQSKRYGDQQLSQKLSLSSIDTTDFFPTNTHEHSSTRVAPKAAEASTENPALPSTPDKNWPASPWNEGTSGRSNKSVHKIASWPDVFGKPPSVSSLKLAAMTQSPTVTQERQTLETSGLHKSTTNNMKVLPRNVGQRAGTDDDRIPSGSKPKPRALKSFQDGYQAGYDHDGMPDDAEVLKGYIQGLIQFISDESKKSRNGSLRDLVAISKPHSSITNTQTTRPDGLIASQENLRSKKTNPAMSVRNDSVYGSQDASASYLFCNMATEPYVRDAPIHMHLNATEGPGTASAHRDVTLAGPEKNISVKEYEKNTASLAEIKLAGAAFPRQFSGNQLDSRNYAKHNSSQRGGHVSAKDSTFNGPKGSIGQVAGLSGSQRMSGLDGAMDELVGLTMSPLPDDQTSTAAEQRSTEEDQSAKANEEGASCFRTSTSKDKQKTASSPGKRTSAERNESSPANTPGSPRKSGEQSPAKAKLEHVTNKFRRTKKDDVRYLSPEEKNKRSQKWHKRFQRLKESEAREVEDQRNAAYNQ